MARPSIPKIHLPKAKSPLSKQNENVAGGGCGQSWKHSYELIRPYGSSNHHKIWLDEFGSWDDLDKIPNPDFIARIEDAIEDTWRDLDKYDDQGVISSDDYDKLRVYLNRASNYASTASKLYEFWSEEYTPPNLRWVNLPKDSRPPGPVIDSPDAHWALDDPSPFLGKCGSGYGEAAPMRANAGDEQKTRFKDPFTPVNTYQVKFDCPSENTIDTHTADIQRYRDMMEAAALNARCAQESIYSIAFYALNKAKMPARAPKKFEVKAIPTTRVLEKAAVVPSVPDLPPGAELPPELPDEDVEEKKGPPTAAILALGAAAIVLIASRK